LVATDAHALHRRVLFAPDWPQAHLAVLTNRIRVDFERLAQFAPAVEIRV
jgi:hypothetical protein